jgi:peptidyl-prolyl cis-trans isomerase D
MLRFLRKYSQSTPVKILYGVLAAAFVIWGVGAVGEGRGDIVAKVYGDTITQRDVDVATEGLRRQYEQLLKGQFTGDLLRNLDLRGRALDQLVDGALLRHEAERLGIPVSDGDVVDAIVQMPELQDNGRFDRSRLEQYLEYERDQGEFASQVRRGLLFQRLQSLVTDGVQVSAAEVEARYEVDNAKVRLAFVRFSGAELGKGVELSDEDLEKYLQEHPDAYRVPEQIRIRYVSYRPEDFASQVQIRDVDIDEQYALHKEDRYWEPEQVQARHILVKVPATGGEAAKAEARKKAEDLLAKVKAGGDFAALAEKNSDDKATASKGGDLGFLARGRMAPEFEAAAFALEPGQVSEVVETPFGFHVIKLEEHRDAGPKPLDSVRDEIATTLRSERAAQLARKAAETDRDRIVKKRSFDEGVGDRPVTETPPFAANADVPGLGRQPALSSAAFALGTGQVSDLIETDDAIYLLTTVEAIPPQVPPLKDVRERVLTDARRARGEALAQERAEALLEQARKAGLDKAAAEAGDKVEETGLFERRGGALPKLPGAPAIRTEAFSLTPEAPLGPKVYTSAGDAVVISLLERVPADMSGFEAAKENLRKTILQQKREAALTAFMNLLRQRAQRDGAFEVRANASPSG